MTRQQTITEKLESRFELEHLDVQNESGNHNVPPGSETHFKVVLVSAEFDGQRLIARHRAINEALAEEFESGLHALALHAYTRDEWRDRFGDAPLSPPCLGGEERS